MSPLLKKKNSKNTALVMLLAFAIPFVITCAAFYLSGITPFGDKTVLIWDAKLQYKDYFGYLWDVLHGNASLDYSASKSLGGQMIGLVAYYLTCPLNLLIYFFKKSQIGLFFSVITILKMSFAGVTCSYFIKKRYNINWIVTLMLSTCYALMEYNVYYCRNIMWLDGAVMLPLACLGVYEMLYNRKKGLLFFSVALSIISNWYSGFMVCLMAGFYFLFELILKYDWRDLKSVIGKAFLDCIRVAADMVLGVLASAVILLPACMSLVGGKASFHLLYTQMNFSWLYTFTGFDINATVNTKTSPLLYCGGIAVVLVVYLFFDKRINIKTRIASALFFVFMTLGFCFKEFELMWTAFVESHSYNFRFAFVFAFAMIMLSAMAIREIQNNENKINKKALLQALGLIGAVVLVLDLTNNYQNRFVSTVYAVSYAVYAVLALIIYNGENLRKKVQWRKIISVAVAALLICAELGVNSLLAYKEYNFSNSGFSSYTEEMAAVVDELKSNDNSFYRLEKNYSYLSQLGSDVATCDALMFNYNSIEHYSSTYDGNVDEFMAAMGYSDSTNIPDENSDKDIVFPTDTYWNSPMLLMESLLGVKYELWQSDLDGLEKMELSSSLSDGYSVYKNPYALPLAYNVSAGIEVKPEYGLNPFENQQMLLSAIAGEKTEVYVTPNTKLTSIEKDTEKYTFRANTSGPMYLYTDGSQEHSNRYVNNCELYVNGEFVQKMCSRFNYNAVYLGSYDKGEEVTVEIKRISKESKAHSGEHTIYTAQLDMNRFENVYKTLSDGFEADLNVQGNTVSGKYTTDINSTVMLTLPYTQGWTVYIDGEKTDYKELAGTFIGIDLTAGTHSIEMKYRTPYVNVGIAATFMGVAGVVLWSAAELFLGRKKKKTA